MVLTPRTLAEPRAVARGRSAHLNLVLVANRMLARVDEICDRHGVTQAQYVALWTLCLADDADAGLPLGVVADGLLNRASDSSRLIDRMVRAKLVERLPNPDDRRSVLIRATAVGRQCFAEITPELQELHRTQWSNLTAREVEQLDELLVTVLWGRSGTRA